jgi:hypothetical protein
MVDDRALARGFDNLITAPQGPLAFSNHRLCKGLCSLIAWNTPIFDNRAPPMRFRRNMSLCKLLSLNLKSLI